MQKSNLKNKLISAILIIYTISIMLDLHIFYNSVSTLIRCLIISTLFLIMFFKYSNKKEKKIILFYFLFYGIYIILHIINIANNNTLTELLYFYKMSTMVMMLYTTIKLGINKEHLNKIINVCLLIICGSIVFCNLFKLGYSSYGFYGIKGNIFSWFKNIQLPYDEISSKGYFHLANQVIAIILLYLPIIINKLKEETNMLNIITLIITLLSLLMIGNRIATILPIIVLIISLFIYIILFLLKKENKNINFIICLILSIFGYYTIMNFSPMYMRKDYYNSLINDEIVIANSHGDIQEKDQKEVFKVFEKSLININFPLYYYPYENDKEFWNQTLTLSRNKQSDSRLIEKLIIQRVKELNNNKLGDTLLGIGYNRMMSIQNIEKDYIAQYYSIGVIGTIILIGVYIVIYIYLLFRIICNLENKLNYTNLMLLLGIGIVLTTAYFSGNLFNSISIIIPLCFIMGIAYNEITKKEKFKGILGFKVYTKSKKNLYNDLKNELKKDNHNIIYNINPLIVCNFYKNQKIIDEFNQEKYNIPDGVGTVLASRMKGQNIEDRIAGVEVVEEVCRVASENKYKIFLYGSKPGIADKAKEELEKTYKHINIVGTCNGYIDEKKALKEIQKKKPDILFVALGSPKQELFIINNKNELKNIKLVMPVGGSLDVLSKTVKRAPKIYCKLKLEWLYRMIKEPKRIKQNMNLFKFVFLVIFKNECYNKKRGRQ